MLKGFLITLYQDRHLEILIYFLVKLVLPAVVLVYLLLAHGQLMLQLADLKAQLQSTGLLR